MSKIKNYFHDEIEAMGEPLTPDPEGYCPNCGGALEGDGFRQVVACEFADTDGMGPDAGPAFCVNTGEGGEL